MSEAPAAPTLSGPLSRALEEAADYEADWSEETVAILAALRSDPAVLAAMTEALAEFGPPDDQNPERTAAFVLDALLTPDSTGARE